MLCTKCFAPVKPVAAVDIDGTLAQYHRHFLEFASAYYDQPMDLHYDGSVPLNVWMERTLEEYRSCKLAYRLGGMKRVMPAYGKPSVHLEMLRRLGVELWITTTRPYLKLDNTDPDTREWLRRHGILYDGLIYDEDKYAVLADIVGTSRVIGVVDDLAENYDRAADLGLHPILMSRTHNRGDRRPVEVSSVQRAVGMLYVRARRWEEANADE